MILWSFGELGFGEFIGLFLCVEDFVEVVHIRRWNFYQNLNFRKEKSWIYWLIFDSVIIWWVRSLFLVEFSGFFSQVWGIFIEVVSIRRWGFCTKIWTLERKKLDFLGKLLIQWSFVELGLIFLVEFSGFFFSVLGDFVEVVSIRRWVLYQDLNTRKITFACVWEEWGQWEVK